MNAPSKTYDVAIVGSGPAGSSAAWHLARAGHDVIILEKQTWPRDKICGGGLVSRAFRELPSETSVPVTHSCHNASINLSDADLSFTARRENPIVSMVMRTDFDQALLSTAVSQGVTFQDECEVTSLDENDADIVLRTSQGTVTAKYVIAADGVNSRVACSLGWKDGRILAPALEWEIPCDAASLNRFADTARFDFGVIDDGYAWVFPKEGHLSVGLGTMRARSQNLPATLKSYLTGLDIPWDKATSRKGQLIPVTPRQDVFAKGRVMLAGDAAGFTDPVTAEGITFALRSGRLAAEAICSGQDDPRVTAAGYQGGLRRELLSELTCGRWLATLLYRFPAWRCWLFRRQGQRLAERMADLVQGELTYRDVMRRAPFWLRIMGLQSN